MSRLSIAKWEPIPIDDADKKLRIMRKALIMHTAVSSASDLHDYWVNKKDLEAQFYINKDGDLFQYLDTVNTADHANAANPWALGCETWDGGKDPAPPWNDAQLDMIVALAQALGCPATLLKETESDGIGYHRQYSSWNPNHHTCPGDVRTAQITDVIIPRLGGDMGVSDFWDGWVAARNGVPRDDPGHPDDWVKGHHAFEDVLANKGEKGDPGPTGPKGDKGDAAVLPTGATLKIQ